MPRGLVDRPVSMDLCVERPLPVCREAFACVPRGLVDRPVCLCLWVELC